MTQEKKQEFTRRLTQCNRSGVILIMYEIIFEHLKDAKLALEKKDRDAYKYSIRKAQEMLRELKQVLDFRYELSKNLAALYQFCIEQLAMSMTRANADGILETEKIMNALYRSFVEAAKQDNSMPMMVNVQQVYAGMTYGRKQLNESYEIDNHRGFLA